MTGALLDASRHVQRVPTSQHHRRERRNAAGQVWKDRVAALQDLGKDEDADGIKSWLRSQYAESIASARAVRARGLRSDRHRVPQVGTRQRGPLGLIRNGDCIRFIDSGTISLLQPMVRALAQSGRDLDCRDWRRSHFNAEHNFTLQYPVMLAPINSSDGDEAYIGRRSR